MIRGELEAAFEPLSPTAGASPGASGVVATTGAVDLLSTTPERLLAIVEAVLGAVEGGRAGQAAGMVSMAGDMMDPEVVKRLKEVQALIRKHFM